MNRTSAANLTNVWINCCGFNHYARGSTRGRETFPAPNSHPVRKIRNPYPDVDVGFVDAAVLSVVEWLNEPKLATLDHRHFGVLRPRHVDALRLIPAEG